MVAGLIGVPMGSFLSQFLKKRYPSADPIICAFGLLLSAPLLTGACLLVNSNSAGTYALIFFGQLALNLNWAVVADILLVSQEIHFHHLHGTSISRLMLCKLFAPQQVSFVITL